MFFCVNLDKELEVAPRFFGPKLREEVERRLREEVEGTCDGQVGFVIAVLGLESLGKGVVREGVGSAVFNLRYRCLTFLPLKGEVMDAVVTSVNKMGFFAEAGPLQVFVSNHLIPEDFEFSTALEPCYQSVEGDQKIQPGCEVRLRIVGTRIDAADIFAVATIKEDYLGIVATTV